MKNPDIDQRLRESGVRATRIRSALMAVLSESDGPLNVAELSLLLGVRGLSPNKTTLYRELRFLVERGWAEELDFGHGKKSYEWAEGHHHHLVCRKCHRVEEVETGGLERMFGSFEKGLLRRTQFSNVSHSLEFYGLCNQCV